MIHNLSKSVQRIVVEASASAGTTDLTSDSVDCADADSVCFIAMLGTLTSTQVTTLYLEESDDDSTFTTVSGSTTAAAADADSNKLLICDYFKPAKRYVRAVLDRGTANAVLNGIIAEVFHNDFTPITQSSTVSAVKYVRN